MLPDESQLDFAMKLFDLNQVRGRGLGPGAEGPGAAARRVVRAAAFIFSL
jgi:hypothetical protein